MWLVYSSLYGERKVEMLNLYDSSRTVVTSSKHCPVNVRTLDFTRCVVALPACICFACVSSFDAGCYRSRDISAPAYKRGTRLREVKSLI